MAEDRIDHAARQRHDDPALQLFGEPTLREGRGLHTLGYALRIDRHAVRKNLVVQIGAGRTAAGADTSDDFATRDAGAAKDAGRKIVQGPYAV